MNIITDFTAGELSRKFIGRPDLDINRRGVQEMTNFFPFFPGGATIRPGFEWISQIGAERVKLKAFIISKDVAYIVEFSKKKIRFWKDGAILTANSSPVEITTPYEDIDGLQFAQDANKLFIATKEAKVHVLEMTAVNAFEFAELEITGNAGHIPFQGEGDYPRAIAIHDGCLWLASTANEPQSIWRSKAFDYGNFTYWETIESTSRQLREPIRPFMAYTTLGSNTIDSISDEDMEKIKIGDTIYGQGIPDDYPDVVTRVIQKNQHQIVVDQNATITGQRQLYAGWYDKTIPEYEDKTSSRDIITADNAFKKTIASDINEEILWLAPGADLIVGTTCGERVIPSGVNAVNFVCKRQTANGASRVQPVMFMNGIIFCGPSGKSLMNYTYRGQSDARQEYNADRIDLAADHILTGILQLEYSSSGQHLIWAPQDSGEMVVCYMEQQAQIIAFFRVTVEGASIESVAVVPDGGEDTLYLSISRAGVRSLLRMGELFNGKHLDEYATRTVQGGKVTDIGWLNGTTATIVYNGAAYQGSVANNEVAAPAGIQDGATVIVGRKYSAKIKTMPVSQAALKKKQIPQITVRVLDSYSFKVGYEQNPATARIKGPKTGDVPVQVGGGWDTEGAIVIEQDSLPLTVLALGYDVNSGG